MMQIVVPVQYVMAGLTAYAAIQHLGLGLSRPRSALHLLIAAMSTLLCLGVLFQAQAAHAFTAQEHLPALRRNILAGLAGTALLPWFVALYTDARHRGFLAGLSVVFGVLLVADLVLPYGLQYDGPIEVYSLVLPWGEAIARPRGAAGPWTAVTLTALLAAAGYCMITVVRHAVRRGNRSSAWILAALGVFLAFATEGILARLAIVPFIELGPVGFSTALLMIGTAVARDTKERLRSSEAHYHALFENAPQAVLAVDPSDGRILQVNAAAAAVLGYARADLMRHTLGDITDVQERAQLRGLLERIVKPGAEPLRFDARWIRQAGNDILMDCQLFALADDAGRVTQVVVSASDMTERRLTEEALRESETRLRAVIGQSPIAIAFARDGITVNVNQAYLQTFGFDSADELRGRPLLDQVAPRSRAEAERRVRGRMQGEAVETTYETVGLRRDASEFPMFISAKRLQFPDGPLTIAFLIDITQQKNAESEIRRLAFNDPLTDLANRRMLGQRVDDALATCAQTGQHCALLLIDLDHFKSVNNTLGHPSGDQLLREAGRRLAALARGQDAVARLGSDAFGMLLADLDIDPGRAAAEAGKTSEHVLQALAEPYTLDGNRVRCTCSIGICVTRDHHLRNDDVIRQAEIAMYEAKKQGRNLGRLFDPAMQEVIRSNAQLESDLRLALENREFVMHYQVQVDSSFLPVGAEALIRWQHPRRGTVAPGEFIPLAEETGLIVGIGRWVLDAACAQLQAWRHDALLGGLNLAINVSSRQFRQAAFVDDVRDALRRHRVDASQLKLELTESMVIDDVESVIATMNTLRTLGVKFSLDDFGTGYSSLQYLKRLPLDQLKIDQSFVRDIAVDPNDHAIVRTVIAVARSLNLDVIAEGVETDEQRRLLVECGCTHFQGYLFGRPAPARDLESLVEANLIGLREAAPEKVRARRRARSRQADG